MKIALVCSSGGHLTEMRSLSEAFNDHETFFVTYESVRTRDMDEDSYVIDPIGLSPWRMIEAFYSVGRVLLNERPEAVVSTGSEIAIPALIWSKIIGAKTIYIESWCRVRALSPTGRIVYPLSDLFLVQWPELTEKVGDKARYEGAVL